MTRDHKDSPLRFTHSTSLRQTFTRNHPSQRIKNTRSLAICKLIQITREGDFVFLMWKIRLCGGANIRPPRLLLMPVFGSNLGGHLFLLHKNLQGLFEQPFHRDTAGGIQSYHSLTYLQFLVTKIEQRRNHVLHDIICRNLPPLHCRQG